MKRSVTLGLAAAAVLAVLLAFTGAAAAEETLAFTSGETTIPVGNINIVNNEQMKVKIDLTNLKTNADGSITVRIGGLNDVVKNLKMKSFTVKLSSSGIDNAKSSLAVSTGLFPITLGDFAKMASGMTITESTEILGIKLLGMINDLTSVTLEILPTATTASVSLDITANVENGTSVNPMIKVNKVDVSKLNGNPNLAFTITSGSNKVSKSYKLDAGKVEQTATPTPTPTVTPTVTQTVTPTVTPYPTETQYVFPTLYQMPTASSTPFAETPAPVLGILGALAVLGCGMILRRK